MFYNFNQTFSTFNIMFIVVSVIIAVIFIITILSIISPKFRGKMMSRQVRATKHMMDYSKEDLENIGTNLGNVAMKVKKNILVENKESLKEEDIIYCKHCGSIIDVDSIFCKKCEKKQ